MNTLHAIQLSISQFNEFMNIIIIPVKIMKKSYSLLNMEYNELQVHTCEVVMIDAGGVQVRVCLNVGLGWFLICSKIT